jgi:folate-binding protein YgfZ
MPAEEFKKSLGAPADFGDWHAEYRAFLDTCAVTARADRRAVLVSGERSAEMLNGLLTNDLADLGATGRHAMLLTPKGRVLTDLRVLPRGDGLHLDVPGSGLQNLLEAFQKYLPPIYATYEDVSGSLTLLGLYGPLSAAAAEEVIGEGPPDEHLGVAQTRLEGELALVIRNRRLAGDGVEFAVPVDAAPAIADRLIAAAQKVGGRPAGTLALDVVRVEAGIPRYGTDIDDSNLAQETGLEEEAISYEKGCYLGQEVVARVHFRGHVNRLLRGLSFGDSAPAPGASLFDGEKPVGTVTSAVASPEYGPIGLGYVRREVDPSSALRWAAGDVEGSATVVRLPFRRVSV